MQTSMLGPNFPAPICCAQCETSRCAGARTVTHSAEIPLTLHFGAFPEAQLVLTPGTEEICIHTQESEV